MNHALASITQKLATQPGALSGHTATCVCGFEASTSLSAEMAAFDLAAHIRFMDQVKR
jgi:hypothetical protein